MNGLFEYLLLAGVLGNIAMLWGIYSVVQQIHFEIWRENNIRETEAALVLDEARKP